MALVKELLRKLQFKYNQELLETLDDEGQDDDVRPLCNAELKCYI